MLRLVGLSAAVATASAYKYHLQYDLDDGTSEAGLSQSAFLLSEGGMYQSHHGPLGTDGPSSISVSYVVKSGVNPSVANTQGSGMVEADDVDDRMLRGVRTVDADASVTRMDVAAKSNRVLAPVTDVYLHVAFLDPATKSAAGLLRADEDGDSYSQYCCTSDLLKDGMCGSGVKVGGFIVNNEFSEEGRSLQVSSLFLQGIGTGSDKVYKGNATFEIVEEGRQYVILAACPVDGGTVPVAALTVDAAFLNPYGYLPGQAYGYLPFYGTLFGLYCLLGVAYLVALLRHRKFLLRLQYCILGVIVAGIVEMAVWFFTYESKNRSGVPTPCNVCPVTSDYIAAVVLNVVKRSVSRVLLLAVALGFGVVHPLLSRKLTLTLVAMGVAYLLFGILDDVNRETAYDDVSSSPWEIAVLFVDLLFTMGIYGGFSKLKQDLTASKQAAKLRMYHQLFVVLIAALVVYCAMTFAVVAVRVGAFPLAWKSMFLIVSFWDVLYLCILAAVAYIWMPGPEAYNYAWYSQGAMNEVEADIDDTTDGDPDAQRVPVDRAADIELASMAAAAAPADSFGIDADGGDGGADEDVTKRPQAAGTWEGAKTNSRAAASIAASKPRTLASPAKPLAKPGSTSLTASAALVDADVDIDFDDDDHQDPRGTAAPSAPQGRRDSFDDEDFDVDFDAPVKTTGQQD